MRTINFYEEDIKQCKLALVNQNLTSLQSAFLMQYINNIEQENKQLEQKCKKQKEVIDKAIEFIDYSSKEIDIEDTYNEIVQTYSLTYDDVDELLDILKEVSK